MISDPNKELILELIIFGVFWAVFWFNPIIWLVPAIVCQCDILSSPYYFSSVGALAALSLAYIIYRVHEEEVEKYR